MTPSWHWMVFVFLNFIQTLPLVNLISPQDKCDPTRNILVPKRITLVTLENVTYNSRNSSPTRPPLLGNKEKSWQYPWANRQHFHDWLKQVTVSTPHKFLQWEVLSWCRQLIASSKVVPLHCTQVVPSGPHLPVTQCTGGGYICN